MKKYVDVCEWQAKAVAFDWLAQAGAMIRSGGWCEFNSPDMYYCVDVDNTEPLGMGVTPLMAVQDAMRKEAVK